MKNDEKVVKYHRQFHLNFAVIISFIIFIYILFHVFTYLTTETISIYEVKQGTITSQNNYRALAIRQETVYTADQEGYLYYFAPNKSRVGVRSLLYAIDKSGNIVSTLNDDTADFANLNDADVTGLENEISEFINDYSGSDFYRVYSFKSGLSDSLKQLYDELSFEKNSDAISHGVAGSTFFTYYAGTPGLIVYNIDGYENLSLEDLSIEDFKEEDWEMINLKNRESILAGEDAYKLITSDDWNLVMPIDSDLARLLSDNSTIEIEFTDDHATTWCTYEIMEKGENTYLVLSLDDSMERYADQRFININLKLKEQNGLKIPNSSIIEKVFFTVPKKYFTRGEDSNRYGLLVETEDAVEFYNTTIYKETDHMYYIDSNDIPAGTKIMMVNSPETYTVGTDTEILKGVYNVNKGYAVFKQIEVVYQNSEYAIVKTGTDYGLSLYDRIVLQGDKISENDMINN